MSENAGILLIKLYEEYKKGNNIEKVKSTDVRLSKMAFAKAGDELKKIGYLPNFSHVETKNTEPICFIGKLSDEAIKFCSDLD